MALGSASVTVAFLLLGLRSGEPPYCMVSAFAALLAWSAYGAAPHVIRAAKALESNARQSAGIAIEITQGSDSPTYQVEVRLASQAIWRITFIAQGWIPKHGEFQGTAYFVPEVEWPALLVTDDSIVHPRHTPIRSAANAQA